VDRRILLCCPSFRKYAQDSNNHYSIYLRPDIKAAIEVVEAADAKGIGEPHDALAQAIELAQQRTNDGRAVRRFVNLLSADQADGRGD